MNCDVCKRNLSDEGGKAVVAVQVSLLGANPMRKEVEELYGKNKFNVCYICQLKSLGIKKKPTSKGNAQ